MAGYRLLDVDVMVARGCVVLVVECANLVWGLALQTYVDFVPKWLRAPGKSWELLGTPRISWDLFSRA